MRDMRNRSDVVVVGIDDASLQALGAWPWKRDVFAKAIDRLYQEGARLVVFDVLFLEKRDGDTVVEEVLAKNKKDVLFAVKLDEKGNVLESVYRDNPYAKQALAHVYPNDDGKVRDMYFFLQDNNRVCIPTLSYVSYRAYTKKQDIQSCDTQAHPFLYQQTNPKTISFIDVVSGKQIDSVKNAVVLVGSVSLDLEDHFVALSGEKIAGVYVHRSMLTTMLNNTSPQPLPRVYVGILLLLACVYASFIALRVHMVVLQILLLVFGVFVYTSVGFAVYAYGYVFPFSLLLLSLISMTVYGFMFRYRTTEKKNEHIRNLFGKYVHKDVLKQLMEEGKDIQLGGEKKDVTVLFSDIRGFTSFSEIMSPEELTTLLNDYLSAMSPQILEEKGTIDKFIGDAIMAFWNAPLTIPHHTLHAVRAALRMEDRLKTFNHEHNANLAIGIGLHKGEVIVGNVGSQDRVNYTILGDVVNTGSRLEGLTKKYGVGILVSEEVREAVDDIHIAFRKLDVITVKGKSEPTTLYEVRHLQAFRKNVIAEYEEALTYYRQGNFSEALALFTKLKDEGDEPSAMMVARIPQIDTKTWDGVWHFDEK
jgi:adenylate cyclase